jgi:hypothetical protein
LNTCFSSSPVSFHAAEANWFFSLHIKSLHSSKGHYKNKIQGDSSILFWEWEFAETSQGWSLWYLHNKNGQKSWGHQAHFDDLTSATCQIPPQYGTILTLVWVTWKIAQPLLNLFNKDPIYLYTRKHGLAKQKALTCIVMVATKKHGQRPS